jgi:hypothetical protein
MKAFCLVVISLVSFSLTSGAQNKAVEKAVIETPGVQDEACKTRIDNFLAREYGITAVKTDYKKTYGNRSVVKGQDKH